MIVLNLPTPPSTNNLFPTSWKTKKRFPSSEYKAWREEAGLRLMTQLKALPKAQRVVRGRVAITYEVKSGRIDLFNHEKALTDLLVGWCVIEGDGPRFLVDGHLRFAEVEGVRVTIKPAE